MARGRLARSRGRARRGLPGKLKGDLDGLNAQRKANALVYEQRAHERCLQDLGRADLVAALAFARERLPDDARYYARTPSIPCVAFNLFPSELVPAGEFDPGRATGSCSTAWIPKGSPAPLASAARATDRRATFSPTFAVVAPEGVPPEGGTGMRDERFLVGLVLFHALAAAARAGTPLCARPPEAGPLALSPRPAPRSSSESCWWASR